MHLKQQKFQCMLEVFYSYRGNLCQTTRLVLVSLSLGIPLPKLYDSYVDGNSINGTQVRIIGLRSKPQRDENVTVIERTSFHITACCQIRKS